MDKNKDIYNSTKKTIIDMKYLKLFENWLLEADGGKPFDPNNPDATPVVDITIADFKKSASNPDLFLTSIFRRAMQTGDKWNPKAGDKLTVNYGDYTPSMLLKEDKILQRAIDMNYKDSITVELFKEKFFDGYSVGDADWEGPMDTNFTALDDDAVKRITNFCNEILKSKGLQKKLEKIYPIYNSIGWDKDRREEAKDNREMMKGIVENIPKVLEEYKKKLKEKKPSAQLWIYNGSEDSPEFEITLEIPKIDDTIVEFGDGGTKTIKDDNPIIELPVYAVSSFSIGGKTTDKGDFEIPYSRRGEIAFGNIMAWISNVNKTKEHIAKYLESYTHYQQAKLILDKEKAKEDNVMIASAQKNSKKPKKK